MPAGSVATDSSHATAVREDGRRVPLFPPQRSRHRTAESDAASRTRGVAASALTLAFACPACGSAVEGEMTAATTAMTCASCHASTGLPEAAGLASTRAADVCPVCGNRELYQQRDFNRKLGLAFVAVGVLSGPFTHWISTVVFVGIDAALYLLVPSVAVCYACDAQQRGFDRAKGPKPFDIAIHDTYRFGKRFPPRRDKAVAGPRARLLAREGKGTLPGATPS